MKINSYSRYGIHFWFIFTFFFLIFVKIGYASENFVAGVYTDAAGNKYLVSGAPPSREGREQWSITSTTPIAARIPNTFNAQWETGAAVGNIWLPENKNVLNHPAGYASGRSYGLTGDNNWRERNGMYWNVGNLISVSQVGMTLIISRLNADGSVWSSRILSYVIEK